MKQWMKRMIALMLVAVMAMAVPMNTYAWSIDGNTPEAYTNRAKDSLGNVHGPTVMTNFFAGSIGSLFPVSPVATIDHETKVDVSWYNDAQSVVYVCDNNSYGPMAQKALYGVRDMFGAKNIAAVTLNLFIFEGSLNKLVPSTTGNLQFMVQVPENVRSNYRDYAMLRLNADGTVSILPDLDDDAKTFTFETNYFATDDVYLMVYAAKGAFDAYKPAPVQPVIKQ